MSGWARRVKGRYGMYVLMFFAMYFALGAFTSVLSVYLTGTGKSAAQMSLIVSSGGLFSLAIVPVAGYLCDRLGKPRLISCIGMGLMGLTALLFAFTRQVWALFILNGLTLSLFNAVNPVSERLAGSSKYRYGILRVWGTLGYAAGAQAAGLLVEHLPGWVLFAAVAGAGFLSVLGFAGVDDPLPAKEVAENDKPDEKVRLSSLLTMPRFLLFLVIMFLFSGCSGVNMNYAPLLLDKLGVATGTVGTVLSLSTLVEIPLILFSNRFMDRFSGKTLLLATAGITLVQYLCYAFAPGPELVIAAMVLLKAIASTMFMMIILKIVGNLVDPRLVITGMSVVNTVNNLGSIVLQNVGGPLADARGVQAVYLLLAGIVALGAVLTLFLKVENRQKVFG